MREGILLKIPPNFQKLFLDFDLELGMLTTFFSRTHPERGNVLLNKNKIEYLEEDKTIIIFSDVKLKGEKIGEEISFEVMDSLKFSERNFVRRVKFEIKNEAIIRDVVVRYVLNAQHIRNVEIGGKIFKHRGANRYIQYRASHATIRGYTEIVDIDSMKRIKGDSRLAYKFGDYLYFRDEPEGDYVPAPWIFHNRFLVKDPEFFCFKGCLPFYNRAFPRFIDALLQRLNLQKLFLDFRERKLGRFPFQCVGAVAVKKGTIFEFKDEWRFHKLG